MTHMKTHKVKTMSAMLPRLVRVKILYMGSHKYALYLVLVA